jgi:prolipoprotein diacylglyceryltransferase
MEQIALIDGSMVLYWRTIVIAAGVLTSVLLYFGLYSANPFRSFRGAAAVPLAALLGMLLGRLIQWYGKPSLYTGLMDALMDFDGDYALLGVFAGCILAVLLLHPGKNHEAAAALDCMSVAGTAGLCLGRLVHFFDSADRGTILENLHALPFAYPITNTVSGQQEYRFATFVVQAIFAGVLLCLLAGAYIRAYHAAKVRPGRVTLLFILLYCSSQIVLDSTRYDSMAFHSNGFVSVVQVFSAIAVVAAVGIASAQAVRENGMRAQYVLAWIFAAAMLGIAGYMEYYVQRHGSRALFAYSVMSAALAALDGAAMLLLRRGKTALRGKENLRSTSGKGGRYLAQK